MDLSLNVEPCSTEAVNLLNHSCVSFKENCPSRIPDVFAKSSLDSFFNMLSKNVLLLLLPSRDGDRFSSICEEGITSMSSIGSS